MTQLTITDKLRNLNHDMSRDLQSYSDLDSIRNSCDVVDGFSFIKLLFLVFNVEYMYEVPSSPAFLCYWRLGSMWREEQYPLLYPSYLSIAHPKLLLNISRVSSFSEVLDNIVGERSLLFKC